ncbi:MAG: ThiF family adenylyltransferase [Flavobacterium sp.]|uniref:ThiF family adenylyltransferase n=1 Tax=Flavobacterium sp. TaxID=239 RepID=UPI001AFEC49F|nr:ThiF family adenylyltransferase [Flavobacterium sp.]MBO9583112.1 ThiF family adenylyltransferase [Flavobacterium sp.]
MNEFEEARLIAFNGIKQIESVEIYNKDQCKYYKLDLYSEVWKLRTEISHENKIQEINIDICFKFDFPLSLPKLYLSFSDYENLKYIPHIDDNRLICTFDSEITRTNVSKPFEIVFECIERAKKIIEEGIRKENFKDFEEEFLSYWECSFSAGDSVLKNVLCLINSEEDIKTPYLLDLKTNVAGFNYIVHNNNEISIKLKSFLKYKRIHFSEQEVFYFEINSKNFYPPYNFSNEDIILMLKSINENLLEKYRRYVNNHSTSIYFVLTNYVTPSKKILIGWYNKSVEINKKGFRINKIKPFDAISKYQKKDKIGRVSLETYTPNRLRMRTAGLDKINMYKFLICGVGSVGSHLVYFLNSMGISEFKLIDHDKLKVENIGRHFLGFNSVKKYKTLGMKDYLIELNPLQEIKTIEDSIVKVIQDDVSFLNNTDYIFVATGKDNIDNWLFNSLKKRDIVKPLIFIWVEPYLAGGHVVYVNPNNLIEYPNLFDENNYKYNVIDSKHYNSVENVIALKEAGCQTTYIPYSSQNLMLFLSSIFPLLAKIIVNSDLNSKIFTWIGDVDFLKENNIDLSDFANNKTFGSIIENYD